MAAYAVQSDMVNLYGLNEVTICSDWDSVGTIQPINITNSLQAASSLMDRYIAVRYTVPLVVVPDDLVRVCCDIGMYLLCPTAGTITEQKQKRYDQAVAFLKDLSSGKATLGAQQNEEVAAVTADIQNYGPPRALTRETMRRVL